MYCGILHSNDVDIHVGKALTCSIIEEKAFNEISNDNYERAKEKIKAVDYVIDTGFPVGDINRRNVDLMVDAVKMGKQVFALCDELQLQHRYGDWAPKIQCCNSALEIINRISHGKLP